MVPYAPVVLAVTLAMLAVYGYRRHQEARRARMREVATRHGLTVDVGPKAPPHLSFDLFDPGSSKQVEAHMWHDGRPDSVFQYRYTVSSGENSRTYTFSAALVALPFRAPHLVVSSENFWTRAKRVVGLRDIELESPQFNDRYHVRCRDERFAITLLDPSMIAWMLSPQSGLGSITFEFGGSWLLCHRAQLDVGELPALLDWASSVRHRLPAVLSELYGG